jgi:predicted protein tyrosine phosphatase
MNQNIKLLFVCSGNVSRSPAFAEDVEKLVKKDYPALNFEIRSAGLDYGYPYCLHLHPNDTIFWADHIFVMDLKHEMRIRMMPNWPVKSLTVIGVSDEYNREQLTEIILFWFNNYFKKWLRDLVKNDHI